MSSDLRNLLAERGDSTITRTIGGSEYHFPRSIPARIGLLLADGMDGTHLADAYFVKDETVNIRQILMGDGLPALIRGDVSTQELGAVEVYLTIWHTVGEQAADTYWDGLGKRLAPAAPKPSAGARSTRSRASTSGTRKKKPPQSQ